MVAWVDRPLRHPLIDQLACAQLTVDSWGRPVLYPNMAAGCDHAHLFTDVVGLLRSYFDQGPDQGWDPLSGNNGHATCILTKEAIWALNAAS